MVFRITNTAAQRRIAHSDKPANKCDRNSPYDRIGIVLYWRLRDDSNYIVGQKEIHM